MTMKRDYSQFIPKPAGGDTDRAPLVRERSALENLGWQPFFAQQIGLDDLAQAPPVRVLEVHRNGLRVLGDGHELTIPPGLDATVGDWLLLNVAHPASSQVLDRKSLFKRRAPGTGRKVQLIAANVDTAFIVTSCNQDFNLARLERYLALASEAKVTPVILLTKVDLCDDPDSYRIPAEALSDKAVVIPLNARSDAPRDKLRDWCRPGQTVVFLGSSGVGKSTLVNALLADDTVRTAPIREDDARGRHTTSHRQLHILPDGCAVLDTPGMREIQLTDTQAGIAETFEDLSELASQCRFRDCKHETEPGCAVRAAHAAGDLDPARLARWRKLMAEERFNSASMADRKASDKSLQKTIRAVKKLKKSKG